MPQLPTTTVTVASNESTSNSIFLLTILTISIGGFCGEANEDLAKLQKRLTVTTFNQSYCKEFSTFPLGPGGKSKPAPHPIAFGL
ncbi:hypothetical protein TSMEX_001812 [Taenia solium]|eukprot:TsM_000293800 transcript=TsM_000293800 gene=TsM_000293800